MAKRQVFYSFHFGNDCWRAGQIRNIGAIEGNAPISSNDWEAVKRKGEDSIKKWINENMNYRSCIIVLIGEETSSRPWVQYEIQHAWKEGKGIVGIHIHGLKNSFGNQSLKGSNPFRLFYIDKTFNYIAKKTSASDINEINLGDICKAYDTPYVSSDYVYNYIKDNIEKWVEEAILIRNKYPK